MDNLYFGKFTSTDRMLARELDNDYERLYSLVILETVDRGEDGQLDVYTEFINNASRQKDRRYEVNVSWVPNSSLEETNEMQSRQRLRSVEHKLKNNEKLTREYSEIVENQLIEMTVKRIPNELSEARVFYIPHKLVTRENATTTKVSIAYDNSAHTALITNSINDTMYKGSALQPTVWDIVVRARMTWYFLLGT